MSHHEAKIDIGYGEVTIREDLWNDLEMVSLKDLAVEVDVKIPDKDDPDDLVEGVTLSPPRQYGGFNSAQIEVLMEVLVTAHELQEQLNSTYSSAIEDAKRRQAEEEREAERRRQAREAVLSERKERLMTEFIGETVKVRERGYKGMRTAVVEVREAMGYNDITDEYGPTGEYEVRFDYTRDPYSQRLEQLVRLDIKVGSRWMTVWDDGDEDLSLYDRQTPVSSAKPAPKYDGGIA